MKLRRVLIVFFIFGKFLLFGFSLFYTLTSADGNQSTVRWEISEYYGLLKMIRFDSEGKRSFLSDTLGSIQEFIYQNNESAIYFSGKRIGKVLAVSNIEDNKKKTATVSLENINLYQPVGICFFNFVLSADCCRNFIFINPENLKPVSMIIRKKGSEVITVNHVKQNALRAELRLTGILAPFWCGIYWLCPETGIILRYRGTFGPGTPETIMELTGKIGAIGNVPGFR